GRDALPTPTKGTRVRQWCYSEDQRGPACRRLPSARKSHRAPVARPGRTTTPKDAAMLRPLFIALFCFWSSLALAQADALQVLQTRLADKATSLRQASSIATPAHVLALQKQLGLEELVVVVRKHSAA